MKKYWPTYENTHINIITCPKDTHTHMRLCIWISKERFMCASWRRWSWAIQGLRNRICTHVIVVHACVYMEPREERQRSETPYRHANFLRRTLAWPPMMMTRTEMMVVVVNANDVVVVVVVITIVRHLQLTVPFLCSWWTEHSLFSRYRWILSKLPKKYRYSILVAGESALGIVHVFSATKWFQWLTLLESDT